MGVTKTLAKKIIAHRNRNGDFASLGDLLDVRGVGDRILLLLSDHAYVLPPTPSSRRSSRAPSRASSVSRQSRDGSSPSPWRPSRRSSIYRRRSPRRASSRVSSVSRQSSLPASTKRLSRKSLARQPGSPRRSSRISSRASSSSRQSSHLSRFGSSPSPKRSSKKSSTRHPGTSGSQRRNANGPPKGRFEDEIQISPMSKNKSRLRSIMKQSVVQVDSKHNISIDLSKLAADGGNLTLCGGDTHSSERPAKSATVDDQCQRARECGPKLRSSASRCRYF